MARRDSTYALETTQRTEQGRAKTFEGAGAQRQKKGTLCVRAKRAHTNICARAKRARKKFGLFFGVLIN